MITPGFHRHTEAEYFGDHEHATEDIPANLAGPETDAEWARLHAVVIQHREGDVDELLRRINKEASA